MRSCGRAAAPRELAARRRAAAGDAATSRCRADAAGALERQQELVAQERIAGRASSAFHCSRRDARRCESERLRSVTSALVRGVELVEIFVGIERRHAAGAGRGDRLAIDVVGDVAGGEHARHAGLRGVAAEARLAR